MPNARAPGQTMLTFWADGHLLRDLDAARGPEDRSRFIREAIVEKLQRMGIHVPKKYIYPPDRTKIVQIVGDNNKNVTLRAAENSPAYRAKKRKKK